MAQTSKARVVGIMFFQLFAMGSISPILSLYLQNFLHFSGTQTGIILGSGLVSTLVAPLFAVYLIDRLISTPRLLMLCQLVMAVVSVALSLVTDFYAWFVLYLLYSIAFGPTIGLVNAIGFHNLKGGSRQFGSVRVWGTIGWIAAAWIYSGLSVTLPVLFPDVHSFHPLGLIMSALGSLVMVAFTVGIQVKHSDYKTSPQTFIPPETLKVLKRPAIVVLGVIYLVSAILDRFYYFGTAPFLSGQGLDEALILPVMSLGQISEIVTLFSLAWMLHRMRYKGILILGLLAQGLRFGLFAIGTWPTTLIGVSLNGLVFAWVYSAITMYVDEHCDERTRSGVHQLIIFLFSGLSNLIGNLAAGWLQDVFTPEGSTGLTAIDWTQFWIIPSVTGFIVMLATFFVFKEESSLLRQSATKPSSFDAVVEK